MEKAPEPVTALSELRQLRAFLIEQFPACGFDYVLSHSSSKSNEEVRLTFILDDHMLYVSLPLLSERPEQIYSCLILLTEVFIDEPTERERILGEYCGRSRQDPCGIETGREKE